eukprot:4605423-Ditylum_brightwellii.AAC.1
MSPAWNQLRHDQMHLGMVFGVFGSKWVKYYGYEYEDKAVEWYREDLNGGGFCTVTKKVFRGKKDTSILF